MQGTVFAAALIGALALLATGFSTAAAAQTSAAPFSQQEPTGLLRQDEAREVARALDEAQLEVGRTIHVDVVVDPDGRRVSTNWFAPVSTEGVGQAAEVPMPVLAEDVNAPDGIVVLVDPFEGTGSFVEAPGLPERDERYLSHIMTGHFRRGAYDDGLIALAYGLEERLAYSDPLPRSTGALQPQGPPEDASSGATVALFAGGTVAVILLLAHFLKGEGYRGRQGPDKGVGFVAARRDAEALLADLAPRVMLLAEKQVTVAGRVRNLEGTTPDGPIRRRRAEALLRRAVTEGFWESFVTATSLAEEDPEAALPELLLLSTEVEAAFGKLGEVEKTLRDPRADGELGGDKEHFTRRDKHDG